MNKATKVTGFALASAAAMLLVSGCGHNPYKSDHKSSAKVGAHSTNSCSGKNGCKGKNSCKGKDGCKGKDSCKGKNECKGSNGCAAKK